MADWELYFIIWSTEKGSNELVNKITGKLLYDSNLPNDEIGSDGSVEMWGITTTAHKAKYVMFNVTVTMREISIEFQMEKIYLVTDETGAHGTGNVINQYTQILEGKHIEIIRQVPRSLETNLLDL